MKKILILALCLIPLSAKADFSFDGLKAKTNVQNKETGAKPVAKATARSKMRPSLEIINDRYVPDDIKKKYKMGDDYFEMTSPKEKPPIIVEKSATPPAPPLVSEVAPVKEAAPLPSQKVLIVEGAPKPKAIPVPETRQETWRARKGELLKDILKRWSDREGKDFVWSAAESPKISKEFSFVGTYEDAVARLMKQDAGTLKMKFADDLPPAEAPPVIAEAPPVPNAAPPKNWFATKDAPLKTVLQAWATMEGATLVWQADEDFMVSRPVNQKTSFESAVSDVLTQYDGKKTRPVGQLYKNPVSGEKVLVIKTDIAG